MTEKNFFQPEYNFLGLPPEIANPERAKVWVLPVPYEATVSYGGGTKNGPLAIIVASRQLEFYDPEFGCEPAMKYGIYTLPPLANTHISPEAMINRVSMAVRDTLKGNPHPELLAVLGGEHSISAGVVRGLGKAVSKKELVVVHIDAHADLRNQYEDSPYSHACAVRRISEVCPVFQIGIRNISEEEDRFRKGCSHIHTVFAEEVMSGGAYLARLADFISGKVVYLTIDLDGFDPSIMPAVGTPEPGGLSWYNMLEIVRVVCEKSKMVKAFDIVELAPIPGMISPDFVSAKLAYKIMSLVLMKNM
jgi:agmatinase